MCPKHFLGLTPTCWSLQVHLALCRASVAHTKDLDDAKNCSYSFSDFLVVDILHFFLIFGNLMRRVSRAHQTHKSFITFKSNKQYSFVWKALQHRHRRCMPHTKP